VNVNGTRRLIEAAASCERPPFFILISSAAVYAPSRDAMRESWPTKPATFYGLTKLEAETALLKACDAGRIRGVVLRPAMVFGPGAPGNLRKLYRLVRAGIVPEFENGAQRKSLVPVGTLVRAITLVAEHRDKCDALYNVAGETLTTREISEVMAAAIGVRLRRVPLRRGPVRHCAVVADWLLDIVYPRMPSLAQAVDTYASSAALDDARIRSLGAGLPASDVVRALQETANAERGGPLGESHSTPVSPAQ
jgi:nucleoside-diphosphate-sugar epimerase